MDSLPDPNMTPALEPPEGVIPNFVNPPTIAPSFVAGLGVMCGVATLGFAARMFTKTYVMKQVQLEDYTLIFGWGLSIVFYGFLFAQAPFSIGRNQWNVNLAQMQLFLHYVNLTEIFYVFCLTFTKLAILIQLKSIFRGTSRDWIYWLFISLIVLLGGFCFSNAVALIAQCVPREKIWNPLVPGICVDLSSITVGSGAFNVALDWLIFALPIYAIFRLKTAIKRKMGICAVFTIGLLACISSCFRLYYSVQLVTATDLTYGIVNLSWSAALEATSAILVACFPVMPRLYRFLRGEGRGSRRSTNTRRYQSPHMANGYPWHGQAQPLNSSNASNEKDPYCSQGRDMQIRCEWLPLEDGRGYSPPHVHHTGLGFRNGVESQVSSGGYGGNDIQKTVTIETRFQPAHGDWYPGQSCCWEILGGCLEGKVPVHLLVWSLAGLHLGAAR